MSAFFFSCSSSHIYKTSCLYVGRSVCRSFRRVSLKCLNHAERTIPMSFLIAFTSHAFPFSFSFSRPFIHAFINLVKMSIHQHVHSSARLPYWPKLGLVTFCLVSKYDKNVIAATERIMTAWFLSCIIKEIDGLD